ncbi:SdpI family protein [Actinomycetospora aeridis]|uniref:SdpI family protein n=1 Tax=Actinomycetospora aeridis TaxID=3129231 RepID=A0ABU8N3C0_9PSEU
MIVPALVLAVAALVVGGAGVLAMFHRLPRNRVLGVRTVWTMGSVDAFRRANRAAAPAFVGAGLAGLVGAVAAPLAATTAAAVTMLVLGALALVGLLGAGGVIGSRFADAEHAENDALMALPATPCTAVTPEERPADCAPATGICGGSCSICPRAQAVT